MAQGCVLLFLCFFFTSPLDTLTKHIVVITGFIKETVCRNMFIISRAECFKYRFSL